MAYIELVIRMPEELKEALDNAKKENAFNYIRVYDDTIYNALKNSIPLPKRYRRIDDAVSRQAVLELIADNDLSMGQVVRGIHALASVTPQEPRWIPVSERLPEIHNYTEKYLVTLERGWVSTALCTQCDGKHWWTYDDVVAWMPLPEPYKAESEGKE